MDVKISSDGSPRFTGPTLRWRALATSLVLVIYVLHASRHVAEGRPQQLLWTCNVGLLAIALGWGIAAPRVLATGAVWLALGTPMWAYGAIAGFGFSLSSILAHVGGLSLGVLGVLLFGFPRGTWWRAALAVLPLGAAARLFTPPEQNVNMAHAIWPGWEGRFSSHLVFLGAFYVAYVLFLFGVERAVRRLGVPERRPSLGMPEGEAP